jgi:hypothetical protein
MEADIDILSKDQQLFEDVYDIILLSFVKMKRQFLVNR